MTNLILLYLSGSKFEWALVPDFKIVFAWCLQYRNSTMVPHMPSGTKVVPIGRVVERDCTITISGKVEVSKKRPSSRVPVSLRQQSSRERLRWTLVS